MIVALREDSNILKIIPSLVLEPETNELKFLKLNATGMPEIVIDANAAGEIVEMNHSQKPGTGVDLGDTAADWIKKLLGNDFRL